MADKFVLTLDSSQITTFLTCPQMWQYEQFEGELGKGLYPLSAPSRKTMDKGTYGHHILDLYYKKRLEGLNVNNALEAAFSYVPSAEEIAALELDDKERAFVKQRCGEYIFNYRDLDIIPEAVEVGFAETIYEDDDNLFVLEGRIDLIGTLQGLSCIMDHKFQETRHELYAKSIQFRNYAMVAKKNLMIVNYIRLHKNIKPEETFVRQLCSFNSFELAKWKETIISIFFNVKEDMEFNCFPRNWSACPGRYNRECIYTPLCEEIDPRTFEVKKQSLYEIRDAWRPW